MRDQKIKVTSAFLLVFSIGFTTLLHAETNKDNHQPSPNCTQAWENSDSLVTSVSKILCQEESANKEVFDNFLKQASNLTGNKVSDSGGTETTKHPNADKPPSTEPKRHPKEKRLKTPTLGKKYFVKPDYAHKKEVVPVEAKGRKSYRHKSVLSHKAIQEAYYVGIKRDRLSPTQRKDLRRKFESLLDTREAIAFLNAIEKGEGGGPITVVGGISGKSADCQRRIRKLNFSGHPKEQGLPNRCFLKTRKYGLSTAAGPYQIVYYRNWRGLRKFFGFRDFSERNQAVAALELVRSSSVKGGKIGDGLIALVQGNVDKAIRKGTDPWASSPYSRWRGKNTAPLLQYVRQELKKLGNVRYARHEVARFRTDTNSQKG